jgi:hypothetical protein
MTARDSEELCSMAKMQALPEESSVMDTVTFFIRAALSYQLSVIGS